ncbi:hypothetical protein [Candidatus Rhabdochlamydia porcellionis]|jgi:hypothetical protein|uniref:Uncharacterized protein n=1 Tax=Candidatus Rhabdochlamydia porcellionis TaxID=225148 RepID=A0ABX8Z232_9BACT|nr:hypothetical protein [Candidatus Rhabdochlamydia porcellionis]QZA58383.1 hypothetical protein RHAB15C_0000256 [Candidatus Rhabdochlamydia porcellionis]
MAENSLAAAAEIVATLSNLSEAQRSSSKDEAYIKSILRNALSEINNPQELKRILTNLASTKGLSDSVRNCLDILMPKVNKLCIAEEASKSSPKDSNLNDDVRKIKTCVNTILAKLQSENSQMLAKDRIQLNHWTQAQDTVGSMAKIILQR